MNFSNYQNLTSLFTEIGNRFRKRPEAVEISQADYDLLTPVQKADKTKIYYIYDASGGGGASDARDVAYDNSESGLSATNVQDAIDAKANDFVEIDYEDWGELTDEQKEAHNWKVTNVPDVGPTPPTPDVPDGKTVTPVNDAEIWLACAGLTDTGYTSLSEVLADTSILQTVLADDNASDYLARCSSFVLDVTSNQTAMSYIGLNNYTANALLDDETWNEGINSSTYFESVLNAKVPNMTNNTTPSGTVIYNAQIADQPAYMAFNSTNSPDNHTKWMSGSGNQSGDWIGYDFVEPVRITKIMLHNRITETVASPSSFILQSSDDNTNWDNIKSFSNSNNSANAVTYYKTLNLDTHRYYRIYITGTYNNSSPIIAQLQFWGRKDVV